MDEHPRLDYVPRKFHWNKDFLVQSLRSGLGRADFSFELESHVRANASERHTIQ